MEATCKLTDLPNDVCAHRIFDLVSWPSLIACSFVCKKLRDMINVAIDIRRGHSRSSQSKTQSVVIISLFKEGLVSMLELFATTLHYPIFASDRVADQLLLAVKSKLPLSICYILSPNSF